MSKPTKGIPAVEINSPSATIVFRNNHFENCGPVRFSGPDLKLRFDGNTFMNTSLSNAPLSNSDKRALTALVQEHLDSVQKGEASLNDIENEGGRIRKWLSEHLQDGANITTILAGIKDFLQKLL